MCYLKNKFIKVRAKSILTCLIVGFLSTLLSACQEKKSSSDLYYPIDSLLRAQIFTLVNQKARLIKTAVLEGEKSKIDFVPDSLEWVKEFEVFNSLSVINKPVYKGLYLVSEKKENGFLKREFTTNEPDLPVQALSLTYFLPIGLKSLEAQYRESNSMYNGTRYLMMEFEDYKGNQFLTHYTISGEQKMFLSDSVNYVVDARVSYTK
jgi:hypothetical protein